MRIKNVLVGIAGLIVPFLLQAQEKKDSVLHFSLTEAKAYALTNNRSILNANLDIESAKLKVWETTAIGLPQVNAKMPFTYTPKLSPLVSEFSQLNSLPQWMYGADQALRNLTNNPQFGNIPNPGPYSPTDMNAMKWGLNADVTVSQLIFSGSYIVGLQSAKVYESLSKLNSEKSKEDVLESVTTSYINVLIASENKVILDSTYQNMKKTFADMQGMGKQGFVEETDVDQMQITLSNLKTSLDMITRLADISDKLLKLQLGVDFNSKLQLTDSLNNLISSSTYEQLLLTDFVLENNVSYQLLDAQVKSSELLLKLKKSAFLPDISSFYQREEVLNKKAFVMTAPNTIGVTLSIPIFSSGSRYAQVGQAKRDLIKAKNTRLQASDGLRVDFYSSRSALMQSYDKYQTETSNLKLAKKIYDRAIIKYKNGVISTTDLTQIQNQYLNSQTSYYSALQNLIATQAKLEKMLTKSSIN